MGWKGTIRSIQSSVNKMERESRKKERELARIKKEYEKMEGIEQSKFEVEEYENYIENIQSIHKEGSPSVDWHSIILSSLPNKPELDKERINYLEKEYQNFTGTFLQKLFNTVDTNKTKLKDKNKNLVLKEEKNFSDEMIKYNELLEDIKYEKEKARKIMDNDEKEILNFIEELNPFTEIDNLGSKMHIEFLNKRMHININVFSDEIVPLEIKSLLKSGKLSIKKMPMGKYNEIYQDYVCSVIVRIAREIFSLFNLYEVIINANDELLNSTTGHKELKPIVSSLIVRDTFEKLNFDSIDPSDSMSNFLHNMNFKKNRGFLSVDNINID